MMKQSFQSLALRRVPSYLQRHSIVCHSSGWTGVRGHDITGESLEWGERPKIVLTGYGPSGFDVQNTVKKVGDSTEKTDGTVHYTGSVLAFPFGCFLWNAESAQDVTMELLAPVVLHRPKVEYLFIGCRSNDRIPMEKMNELRKSLHPIVVEQMGISNAIGTFNILNAEDRRAAVGLIIDRDEVDDE